MAATANRNRWIVLLVALAAIGFVAWWGTTANLVYESALSACVDDAGTGGALGIVQWARRLGVPVQVLHEPLRDVAQSLASPRGNCVLTAGNGDWSPWSDDLSSAQWLAVREWIERGNTLVVLTTAPRSLPQNMIDDVVKASTTIVDGPPKAPSVGRRSEEADSSYVVPKPETSDVRTGAGRVLSVRAGGPRYTDTPGAWESAGDAIGTVWHRIPLGDGALYLILDDYAWTNAGFDQADNAAALAELLQRELHGGVLAFDEYRHGHGRPESLASHVGGLPGASTFALIAALLVGLYVVSCNVRFGPPEALRVVERRTSREYVEAVAYLNERARAAPLAVDSILRRLKLVARHRGRTQQQNKALVDAEAYVSSNDRPKSPWLASQLARDLVELRKKLYGS